MFDRCVKLFVVLVVALRVGAEVPELTVDASIALSKSVWCAYAIGSDATARLCEGGSAVECAGKVQVCDIHSNWCERYFNGDELMTCKQLYVDLVALAVGEPVPERSLAEDPEVNGDSRVGTHPNSARPGQPPATARQLLTTSDGDAFRLKRTQDKKFDPLYALVAGGGWLSIKRMFYDGHLEKLLPVHVVDLLNINELKQPVVNAVIVKVLGEYRYHGVRRTLMASQADMKAFNERVALKFNAEGSSDLLSDFDVNMKGVLSGEGVEVFNEIFEATFGHRANQLYERHFRNRAKVLALPLTAAFLFDTNVYAEDFVQSEQFAPDLRYFWNREMFIGSHKPIRPTLEADGETFSLVKLIRDAATYAANGAVESLDAVLRRVLPSPSDLSPEEVKRVLGDEVSDAVAEQMSIQLHELVQTRVRTAAGCVGHQQKMLLKRAREVLAELESESQGTAAGETSATPTSGTSGLGDTDDQRAPLPTNIKDVQQTLDRLEALLTKERFDELSKVSNPDAEGLEENLRENDVGNFVQQKNSQYYSMLSDAVPDAMGYTFPDSGTMMPCAPHGDAGKKCLQYTVLHNVLRLLVARDASEAYAAGGAVRTTVLVTQAGVVGYAGNPRKNKPRPTKPKSISPVLMSPSGRRVKVNVFDEPVWLGASDLLSALWENVAFFIAHIGEMAEDEVNDVVRVLAETGKYFGRLGETFAMMDNLNPDTLRLDDTPDDNPHRVGLGPVGYQFLENVFRAMDPETKPRLPFKNGLGLDTTAGSTDALLLELLARPLMHSSELLVHAAKNKGYFVKQVKTALIQKAVQEAEQRRKRLEVEIVEEARAAGKLAEKALAEPENQAKLSAAGTPNIPTLYEMREHVIRRALPFVATRKNSGKRLRDAVLALVRRVSSVQLIRLFHKNGCTQPRGNSPMPHCMPSITEECSLKLDESELQGLVGPAHEWAPHSTAYQGRPVSWEMNAARSAVGPLRGGKLAAHLTSLKTLGLAMTSLKVDLKPPMTQSLARDALRKGVAAFEEDMSLVRDESGKPSRESAGAKVPVRVVGFLDKRMAKHVVEKDCTVGLDGTKPAVCDELIWRLKDDSRWEALQCEADGQSCELKSDVLSAAADGSDPDVLRVSEDEEKPITAYFLKHGSDEQAEQRAGDEALPEKLASDVAEVPTWPASMSTTDLLVQAGGVNLAGPKPTSGDSNPGGDPGLGTNDGGTVLLSTAQRLRRKL